MTVQNQIPSATVVSIQVGQAKQYVNDDGKAWTSAIHKHPVNGPVQIRETGVVGDQQVDLKNHGGTDKAILAYSADHFSNWVKEFEKFGQVPNLGGAFGENLTITGLQENRVCIGDIFKIGTARLQVSQPRQPCWKLSSRWNIPKLEVAVQKTGRTGWYLRIVESGIVEAGDEIVLIDRLHSDWSIAAANGVMYAKPRLAEDDLCLAACESLSNAWKTQLENRANKNR